MNAVELSTHDGVTPTMAVDYIAVEIEGRTQTAWADERGSSQQRVSENVRAVKELLQD